jgi:hypothetical protein
MWDPFGSDMKSCGWVVHRSWLGPAGRDGAAGVDVVTDSAKQMTEEDVRSMGNGVKYDEVWSERMEASGFSSVPQLGAGRADPRGVGVA